MRYATFIPRTFHQIWLGTKQIDPRFVQWAREWRGLHPDWNFILWVSSPEFLHGIEHPWIEVRLIEGLVNQWAFNNVRTIVGARAAIAAQSDILRYEIIARHGGVYIDMDVEPFAPIDDFLPGVKLFCCDEYGAVCGNYMFGSAVNHPAMWSAVRELAASFHPIGRKRSLLDRACGREGKPIYRGILQLTGPNYLASKIQGHPDCVLYPWQLFNPLHPRGDASKVAAWPECSVANHHYAGTWYDQNKVAPNEDLTVGDGGYRLEAP